MLLLGFLLLPMALTAGKIVRTENYTLSRDGDTINNVRVTKKSPYELNLSNLGLKHVGRRSAFDHVTRITNLNLANNLFSSLPKFVFANLTNLKNLSLADNNLNKGYCYDGLRSLKILDISNNPPSYFDPGYFFGLTQCTKILTSGLEIWYITTTMFENPSTLLSRQLNGKAEVGASSANKGSIIAVKNDTYHNQGSNPRFEICIKHGLVRSLEPFKEDKNVIRGCHEVELKRTTLPLSELGIGGFISKWYRLRDRNVKVLDLGDNEIVNIKKPMLNHLPPEIVTVILRGNKIERLQQQVIENVNSIELLDLSYNRISEIAENALEKMNLANLTLNNNLLTNTQFLNSLPTSIQSVTLSNNEISIISDANFAKFPCFHYLNLISNRITEAKAQQLRGFSSLMELNLAFNRLSTIEPGFFQDLKNLKTLDLYGNSITSLEKGVFSGLKNIAKIDLAANELMRITSGVFSELPDSLQNLFLHNNQIESLGAGSFVNVPKKSLSLKGNKISKIEKGSFNIPSLEQLELQDNLLKKIDGEWFKRLGKLDKLSLDSNGITTIKKGAAKYLNHLSNLSLRNNSIETLENGALFGLSKTTYTRIDLWEVPVKVIECGLFDDIVPCTPRII